MKIPPNFGEEYSKGFEGVYSKLAQKFNIPLLPFLLEGVAAKREYTQNDGIHPLGNGYEVVAETVWTHLEPMLPRASSK
jgi:acyl-CoA thioesterase I